MEKNNNTIYNPVTGTRYIIRGGTIVGKAK